MARKGSATRRRPAIFTEPVEEREARAEAPQKALEAATKTDDTDPEMATGMSQAVLETQVYAFRNVLTGEPAADIEPPRMKLKLDSGLSSRWKNWLPMI